MIRAALLVLLAFISAAEAETFYCAPTLTRILLRSGQDWKEVTPNTANRPIIRELMPNERRAGKAWGVFLDAEAKPIAGCTRYDTAMTCGSPGNTIDFNVRTGRYVRTYFSSYLSRDSSEIFIEAGRCSTELH